MLKALAKRGFKDASEARTLLGKGARNGKGEVINLTPAQIDAVLESPGDYGLKFQQ